MAYSNFSLDKLEQLFGIKNQIGRLFAVLPPLELSDWLKTTYQNSHDLPTRTEKAKSETIVFPFLVELRNRNNKYFTIYSGDNLIGDETQGLNGECDFILAKEVHSFSLNYPIIQVVEAKNHDIDLGIPQCAAQMMGARLFNERKKVTVSQIYGCVTTGDEWRFLVLKDKELTIDDRIYYFIEMGEILAVFQEIIDFYKKELA